MLKIANYNDEVDMIDEITLSITIKNLKQTTKECECIVIDDEFYEAWQVFKHKATIAKQSYYIYLLNSGRLYFTKDPLHPSKADHFIQLKRITNLSSPRPAIDPKTIRLVRQSIDKCASNEFNIRVIHSSQTNNLTYDKCKVWFSNFFNI